MWNFDGRPIQTEVLFNFGKALETRGPDGGRNIYLGPLGMAFRGYYTTPHSCDENQPISSPWGHTLTWDGRLDNRSELIAALPSSVCEAVISARPDRLKQSGDLSNLSREALTPLDKLSDAEIILASYVVWGIELVQRLIGEFAFSLWDHKSLTLLLARDFAGTRPMNYRVDAHRAVWSSELGVVLKFSEVNLKPNGQYAAGYLSRRTDPRLTPYEGVHPVPPGCNVLIRQGRSEVRRYWKPDALHEIHYQRDMEYEEHFVTLFREAVRCRLRADRPLWCELSGGLDSSSVACMADEIISHDGCQHHPLETVSWIFDRSSTADERNYIVHVERHRNRRSNFIRDDDCPALVPWPADLLVTAPSPQIFFAGYLGAQGRLLGEHGARALLTGFAGDHLCWSEVGQSPPDLADLVHQLRLRDFHRATRAWCLAEQGSYFQMLLRAGILFNLPMKLHAKFLHIPSWLSRKFVRSMNVREHLLTPYEIGPCSPSRRVHITVLEDAISFASSCFTRELSPIELRYPFLHKPLVEFCLAVPMEQKVRPVQTRSLHRRALGNLLPRRIIERKDKRAPDEAIYRAIARERIRLRELFRDSRTAWLGYINARAFQQELEAVSHGAVSFSSVALTRTITMEFWLRSLDNQRFPPPTLNALPCVAVVEEKNRTGCEEKTSLWPN
jgi:asparagine synthase (glutamine-hydrolysing)